MILYRPSVTSDYNSRVATKSGKVRKNEKKKKLKSGKNEGF